MFEVFSFRKPTNKMAFEAIYASLTGGVLGKNESTDMSKLLNEVQELTTSTQVTQTEFEKYELLRHKASALRLGGTCSHGGDKGPNCTLCMGKGTQLVGPFVQYPPGLDYVEYQINQTKLNGKQSLVIDVQHNRVDATLKSIDGLL
jgi:hypothetical protein